MLLPVRFLLPAIALAAVAISPLHTHAAECTIPNAFTAGTPAVAAEVNANFATVASAVDDNDDRVDALRARIAEMRRQLPAIQEKHSQLQSENTALLSRLAALQGNSVLDLDGVLTRESDTLAQFSGVNVQIVNGTGVTDGAVNGVGNLIVGYNEKEAGEDRTGSHTAVVGIHHAYSSYAGLVVGNKNTVSGIFATVSGGSGNTASGEYSSVSGGSSNTASGGYSSVSGGESNDATAPYTSISGGNNNTASGEYSSVSGGMSNMATGLYSSVIGGSGNEASGEYSSIIGGTNNRASGDYSSVTGGSGNNAGDPYSTISACENCITDGEFDFEAQGIP